MPGACAAAHAGANASLGRRKCIICVDIECTEPYGAAVPKREYLRVWDPELGVLFVFAFDRAQPDRLHIEMRPGQTYAEAIRVWIEGRDRAEWQPEFRRYYSENDRFGILWFWLEEGAVMIFSMFPREE